MRLRRIGLGLLLFALFLGAAFAAYGRSVHYGFVQDDFLFARPLTARQLLSTFAANWEPLGTGNAHYRPVVALTLAADYELHDARPAGYHRTNLVLMAVCAWAAFALLLRLGASRLAAFVGAGAWLLHPMSASAAAWCAQRTDSVMAIFYLLALWAALAASWTWRSLAAVIGLGLLALGSKEMAVTLPLALAAVLVALKPAAWRDRLRASAWLAVLAAAYVAAWTRLFPEKSRFFLPAPGRFASLLFPVYWPTSYARWWNASDPEGRAVATVVGFVLCAAWLFARRHQRRAGRLLLLALVWPLLTIGPIFGLDDPDSYRLGLLPAFGFALAVAAVATAAARYAPVVVIAAAVGASWLLPMTRASAAVWGPGGFQYQSLLKWRSQDLDWQARLSPDMRRLFERQVRQHLGEPPTAR